ncbi:2-dehydro-3-deoxyphosphooctonate aldolase 1 [Galdieria sulphuraria]|nr:2-dehydro-3-deoxyphosphooctonate aldolase 1 [Galdieria sulphuraria]
METQHTLIFSQDFSKDNIFLVELEESLLELVENNERAPYFVGCPNRNEENLSCAGANEAYFCTERKTFKVFFRESSNYCVVPVVTLLHGHLELLTTGPRIDVLRYLIGNHRSSNNLVTLNIQQILDNVQISRLQLIDELRRMHIVPVEDGLKILTDTEIDRALDDIISTGTLQNWEMPLRLPPAKEILKYCGDQYSVAVRHCLDFFCIPRSDNYLTLDEYSVCRFKAMGLLQSFNEDGLSVEWSTFETKWQNRVPDFFQPRMEMLSGLAIFEEAGPKMLIHALFESHLPEDIDNRVKLLFQKKSNWTLEEIEPYLLPVVSDVMKIEHILRKHCRILKTIHSLGGVLWNRLVGSFAETKSPPFFVICGNNVIEHRDKTLKTARKIKEIVEQLQIPCIFKSSFDKANRTSHLSFRGVGLDAGLEILKAVKEDTDLPVLTDVHETWQCNLVSEVVDVLQIPSFLCRQTDLCQAAAETGRIVHLKKGEFASPTVMVAAVEKVRATGNDYAMICERGFCFGYCDLVVDPRSLVRLRAAQCPVVMDITHALQQPSSCTMKDGAVVSAGERYLIPTIGRMAAAVGVDGIFIEVDEEPDKAPVDSHTQWPLSLLRPLLEELLNIARVSRGKRYSYKDSNQEAL